MTLDPQQSASTRRLVVRALFLVLPLAVSAFAAPRLYRMYRAVPRSGPAAEPAAEPPRPSDSPTPEQIEAARAAAERLGAAQRGWERVEIIAPGVPPAPDVEVTAPFQGFGLSLESEPEGATVTVDGRALGETPFLAGLPCEPGAAVRILVARASFKSRELTTRCRADTLVKLRVRLQR